MRLVLHPLFQEVFIWLPGLLSSFSFSNFHDYSVDLWCLWQFPWVNYWCYHNWSECVLNIFSVVSIKIELTWFVLVMVESSEPGCRGTCFHWKGFSPHLLASWTRIIIWFRCSTGDEVGGKPPISVESVNCCVAWYTASYPQCEDS